MNQTAEFRPLPQTKLAAAGCYVPEGVSPPPVNANSEAIQVMTDLSRVPAATVDPKATLEEANQSMILRGVRLLLVVGEARKVVGLVTSADILGEKPVLVAQSRRAKRSELLIADVMIPVEAMETLHIDDVRKASVGNIIATLKAAGRAHALVVGQTNDGKQSLAGIFSASQIARQLGVQIHTHEMARTFAEIEAVISGV
ncbi:MAG: CBS domain-containing protein [Rhodocyclaceae bacterium]